MALSPNSRSHHLPAQARQRLLVRVAEVIARHPEVAFCYAHGSFVQSGPFRDLDLAIYLFEPLPPSRFAYEDTLERELTHVLRSEFPVDVRIANGAPLAFQHHAYQGQLVVDRDSDLRASVLVYVATRYLDLKPILDHHAREAFGSDSRP